MYKKQYCRICGGSGLQDVLYLPDAAIAGGFIKSKEELPNDKQVDLTLQLCNNCGLAQCAEVLSTEDLFTEYSYSSSDNKKLSDHFVEQAEYIKAIYNPNSILEIGGNDGVLLKNMGCALKVNVDPSDVALKSKPYCTLINEPFTSVLAEQIRNKFGQFEVICSSNSFAHIDDIKDVVRGIKLLLKHNGMFLLEVHWLAALVGNAQIGFIYHEHMSYYTIRSLSRLFEEFGLTINDAYIVPNHGGSIRAIITNNTNQSTLIKNLVIVEGYFNLDKPKTYKKLSDKIDYYRSCIMSAYKKHGELVGYGASGQANIILGCANISNEVIVEIIDDSSLKHGTYTPKTHIPIVKKDVGKHTNAPIIILSEYFTDHIINQNPGLTDTWIRIDEK